MLDKDALKESLTDEEIIEIVTHLGSDNYKYYRNNIIFQTICHNDAREGSLKLYYYTDSKTFHCYTSCNENFDIYGLIQKVKDITFPESIKYVSDFVNREPQKDEEVSKYLISDWDWLGKLNKNKKYQIEENKILNNNLLNQFIEIPNLEFIDEGINYKTQETFRIGYSLRHNRITIPIFDDRGNLISVKGRVIKELENELEYKDKKYIAFYNYSNSLVLYGLHKTLPYIEESKKLILYEAEKSVIKSYQNEIYNCCSIGGSEISEWHFKKIIELSNELILAFDKGVDTKDKDIYKKIINRFKKYIKVSVIYDNWNMLEGKKSSPIDEGIDKFKILYDKRFKIN